jgi:hypothetical protein
MATWINVKDMLENPKYQGRTIPGIAKELGVDRTVIEQIISEKSDEVVKFSTPADNGEDLFTTRDYYRVNASPVTKIINAIRGSNTAI